MEFTSNCLSHQVVRMQMMFMMSPILTMYTLYTLYTPVHTVHNVSPCRQDADDVHDEPDPDHVGGAQAARPVADGVRSGGHREHEGVTHADLR